MLPHEKWEKFNFCLWHSLLPYLFLYSRSIFCSWKFFSLLLCVTILGSGARLCTDYSLTIKIKSALWLTATESHWEVWIQKTPWILTQNQSDSYLHRTRVITYTEPECQCCKENYDNLIQRLENFKGFGLSPLPFIPHLYSKAFISHWINFI